MTVPSRTLAPALGFAMPRRATLLIALLVVLALTVALVRWALLPAFVPLFRDLPLEDAARISDRLDAAGIAYRLAAGGSTVEVSADLAARARVVLARDGLPRAGRPGLELFDAPNWGMTEFTQRVTYRRALEGELERTVRGMQGVEDAQVHLTLAENSPLRRMEHPAEAVVMVTLHSGSALRPDAVEGITHLISGSVERLAPDHVAVLDDAGHLLTATSEDSSGFGQISRQLDIQRSVERDLETKAERMLTTVLGAGQARVQVSALLSFDRVDRTTESFNPDGQVLQNEQRIETAADVALDPGEMPSTSVTNVYQNSRQVENVSGAVGSVRRLTVAVAVNSRPAGAARARSGSDLANVQQLVRDAVGLDSTRGDRLTVTALPFDTSAALIPVGDLTAETAPPPNLTGLVELLARPLVALTALLVLFLFGRGTLRSIRDARGALPPPAVDLPMLAEIAVPMLDAPPPAETVLQRRLASDANDRPQTAVRVLRAWLAEP